MNLFLEASREQYRFLTSRGTINTEDLWQLKLEDLNTIAKDLNRQIKAGDEENFIAKRTTANTTLNNKFELVKEIIAIRLEEAEKKLLAKERAVKRAQLIELIGKKEVSALESKSIEDLKAELAGLD
jgi:hypothetical protein